MVKECKECGQLAFNKTRECHCGYVYTDKFDQVPEIKVIDYEEYDEDTEAFADFNTEDSPKPQVSPLQVPPLQIGGFHNNPIFSQGRPYTKVVKPTIVPNQIIPNLFSPSPPFRKTDQIPIPKAIRVTSLNKMQIENRLKINNYFIFGSAGTGKTVFACALRDELSKNSTVKVYDYDNNWNQMLEASTMARHNEEKNIFVLGSFRSSHIKTTVIERVWVFLSISNEDLTELLPYITTNEQRIVLKRFMSEQHTTQKRFLCMTFSSDKPIKVELGVIE